MNVSLALQSPQLNVVETELGREQLTAIIVKSIKEVAILSGSSNFTGENAADAMIMAAESIINNYWHMKIDEVFLVLSNGIKNHYGMSNKNLNVPIIFDWFKRHEQEREDYFYNQHLELKNSSGNQADRSPEPRLAKDVFQESVDQKVEQRINAYKEKIKENEA